MAKLLIVTQGYLGHLIPALGLAKELQNRGHHVWISCIDQQRSLVERSGIPFVDTQLVDAPTKRISESMEQILQVVKHKQIDLIICDSSLSAPAFASEYLNLPWISFSPTIPMLHYVSGNQETNRRLRYFYQRILNKTRESFQLEPFKETVRTRGDLAGLSPFLHLVMVYPVLAVEEDLPPQFKYVGPCALEEELKRVEIDHDPSYPMIVISVSSLNDDTFYKLTEDYLSNCIQLFSNKPLQVVITSSRNYKALERKLPENIHWVKDFPVHDDVLPNCDLLITHGGSNTVQKGIKYGVPMIIIPLGNDHPIMAKQCQSLGVAEVLKSDKLSYQPLEETVNKMLSTNSYQLAANKYKEKYRQYHPNMICTDQVEHFLNTLN